MIRYLKGGVCDTCFLDILVMFRFKNDVKAFRCPAPTCKGVLKILSRVDRDQKCEEFDRKLKSRALVKYTIKDPE